MNREPRSLALLGAVNPVIVDQSGADSAHALAAFDHIVAQPRQSGEPRTGRAAGSISGRPRVARFRLAAGGGVAALTSALVIIIVISGSTATPAFAGWTTRPTAPASGQIAGAVRACRALVPVVVVDTRGPYTAAVFGNRDGGVACVTGQSMSFTASFGAATSSHDRVAANDIQSFVATGSDSNGHAFVLMAGRVGSAVTSVTIHRSNRTDVVASVKDGWYLAWWPARVRATNGTVGTTHGRHTITLPALATQAPISCAGRHDSGCAAVQGGSGGSGLFSGPPTISGAVSRPFGATLLFVVYNARRVQLCLHQGTAPQPPEASTPPATNCVQAQLLTKRPGSYPVQRNLLQVFRDSVWVVHLPSRIPRHGALTADVTAFGFTGWGSNSGGFTVTW